jgi:hypothetical protein
MLDQLLAKSYKVINDDRLPILIFHDRICYPQEEHLEGVDEVDTSYPGILISFEKGYYLLEDGLHRIEKWHTQKIYKSLFYVVTTQEYKDGLVDMITCYSDGKRERDTLGEWNHNALDPVSHKESLTK